jgi:hypothetical protein
VDYHGRSRFEVPWQTLSSRSACLARLQESRRIRIASLDLWPDVPHLENTADLFPPMRPLGPIECFMLGLRHEAGHLAQIRDVLEQARDYRWRNSVWGRLQSSRWASAGPVIVGVREVVKKEEPVA